MKLPTLAELHAYVAEGRKAVVALIGAATQVLALNLLSGPAEHDVQVGLAVLTAIAAYLVPNEAPAPAAYTPEDAAAQAAS